ncbi:hypothetical protein [Motiliproteus sp.]|uniref:hypothetical protein n=1 Tax=Motiliproteus sp. TaxID=1898955 RepID=UPI003BA9B5FA
MRINWLVFSLLLTGGSASWASLPQAGQPPDGEQPIRAAFEPLPPQIGADGEGLVRQLFERLEQQGLAPFQVQMMPYSRAKRQLLSGEADLAGFTPVRA